MEGTTTFALLLAFALGAGAIPACATPLPPYGVFVFGSMCTAPYSGDASGHRLTLMRYGDGDHVLFQWSEGPAFDGIGYAVKIDGFGHISFSVDEPGYGQSVPLDTQSYTGQISAEAVTLSGGYSSEKFTLPRVRDLAAHKAICQPIPEGQK